MNRSLDKSKSRRFAPVQWAAVIGSLAVLVWSIPGLIVNPDFAIGDEATSKLVLGVDMNGWHALSGFLVAIPGLLVASRPQMASLFNISAAAGLITTGIWALLTPRSPAGCSRCRTPRRTRCCTSPPLRSSSPVLATTS